MTLPTISSYGHYSSDNYGAHTLCVQIGPLQVWFSYKTPIAFQLDGHARVVSQNCWAQTTGKHLNWIDGGNKAGRVSRDEFERLWTEQVVPILTPYEEMA